MDATEISPLTEEAITKLLVGRDVRAADCSADRRRRAPRWPFPGTVELWIPDENGTEQHNLATCLNLSLHGLGMLFDSSLPVGLEFALAIHQPEVSFHGRGVVRHSTETENGHYIGVQFVFDKR